MSSFALLLLPDILRYIIRATVWFIYIYVPYVAQFESKQASELLINEGSQEL